MNAPQTPLQESSVKIIAGYALQQKLGSGSFATVYKGIKIPGDENDSDADTVAIKVITRMSEKLTKKVLENLEMEVRKTKLKRNFLGNISEHFSYVDKCGKLPKHTSLFASFRC
jgi:hypothetical protein